MSVFIQCVSIPRSGHHLLVNLLRSYYREDDGRTDRFSYCGHYGTCRTHPCSCYARRLRRFARDRTEPQLMLQKSHDRRMPYPQVEGEPRFWKLVTDEPELEVGTDHPNLIQIRDPVMSTISDYRMSCGEFTSPEKWFRFAEEGMHYRRAFLEKWILGNPHLHSGRYQVLRYEDLIERPSAELERVVRHLSPSGQCRPEALDRALVAQPVAAKWSLDDFAFRETIPRLQAITADAWERALRATVRA